MSNAQTVYAPFTVNTIQSGNSTDAGITIVIDSRQFVQSVSMIINTGSNGLTVSILTRVIMNGTNTIEEIKKEV